MKVNPSVVCFAAIVSALAIFLALVAYRAEKPKPDPRVAGLQAQVDRCKKDEAACEGGFVKEKSGEIQQIVNCGALDRADCGVRQVNTRNFLLVSTGKTLGDYEYIVLPGDASWDLTANQFCRQFIMKPAKK